MTDVQHSNVVEDCDDDAPVDITSLMPAFDALILIEEVVGGSATAKREIADRMRDGRLDTFAARAWDSTRLDITKAWSEEPDTFDEKFAYLEDFAISVRSWRRSIQWSLDQDDWRWPSGRFTAVQSRTPTLRFMFEGVHFDPVQIGRLADLLRRSSLAPELDGTAGDDGKQSSDVVEALESYQDDDSDAEPLGGRDPKKSDAPSRGPKTRNSAWGIACVEVIKLKEAGSLFGLGFEHQIDLQRHLIGKFEYAQPLGQSSLRHFTSVIWEAFAPKRTGGGN